MNNYKNITQHSFLLWQLTRKEIISRTRGSILGVLWFVISPLIMLSLYSIVFGTVFQSKLAEEGNEGSQHFILFLFIGLIIHSFFSDCLTRASNLISSHSSLVKKIIFPIEILPWVSAFSSFAQVKINFIVFFIFALFLGQSLPITIFLLPIVFLPFFILIIGIVKIIATIGVFVRDISHVTGMISTIFLFASPIFYPIERLPTTLQPFIYLNPISLIVIEARKITLLGVLPDFKALGIYMIVALFIMVLSNVIFKKARPFFADVL